MIPVDITQVGTGTTSWIMPNFHLTPFNVGIPVQVSGSVTWNLETTNDKYWTVPPASPVNVTEVVQASTIAQTVVLTVPVTGYRFNITAGSGTLTAQGVQAGITNVGR
jgi:hypothetical protein